MQWISSPKRSHHIYTCFTQPVLLPYQRFNNKDSITATSKKFAHLRKVSPKAIELRFTHAYLSSVTFIAAVPSSPQVHASRVFSASPEPTTLVERLAEAMVTSGQVTVPGLTRQQQTQWDAAVLRLKTLGT